MLCLRSLIRIIGLKSWSEKYVVELHSLLLRFRSSLLKIWNPHLPTSPEHLPPGVTCQCHMHWPFLVSEAVLTVSSLLPEATSTSWPHTPWPKREMFVTQCSSLICLQRRSLLKCLSCNKKKIILELNFFIICFSPSPSSWQFMQHTAQVSERFL